MTPSVRAWNRVPLARPAPPASATLPGVTLSGSTLDDPRPSTTLDPQQPSTLPPVATGSSSPRGPRASTLARESASRLTEGLRRGGGEEGREKGRRGGHPVQRRSAWEERSARRRPDARRNQRRLRRRSGAYSGSVRARSQGGGLGERFPALLKPCCPPAQDGGRRSVTGLNQGT